MSKKNIFEKKIHKSLLSITKIIESFFTLFKNIYISNKKKIKNYGTIDKKIFIAVSITVLIIIGYFLTPAFFDKNKVRASLENQILNQYNLEVKLDEKLRYGIFPKPHFYSKKAIIKFDSTEVAKSNNTKILISIKNFFLPDELKIKNLIFKETDFKIDSSHLNFFIDLLNIKKINHSIKFINSKLFYLNKNDEVMFLTNIKNLNFFYEEIFVKKLSSKSDIFNIPVSLDVEHLFNEKKFNIELKSHPLRLQIENESNYYENQLDGSFDLSVINKSKKINYSFKNNSLKFDTNDKKIKGEVYIKPFFLSSSIDLHTVNLKEIFDDNSVLINILKTEILNNINLNGKLKVKVNNFKGLKLLDGIKFNILLEQGDIFVQNFEMIFKDSILIKLSDTQLIINNNDLNFTGYISLDFLNINDFYSHYQINRKYRKKIKKMNFGFFFNLNEKFVEIDNFKIDGVSNKNLNKFLNNLNSKKQNIFNKITFRNSIKEFFNNL